MNSSLPDPPAHLEVLLIHVFSLATDRGSYCTGFHVFHRSCAQGGFLVNSPLPHPPARVERLLICASLLVINRRGFLLHRSSMSPCTSSIGQPTEYRHYEMS